MQHANNPNAPIATRVPMPEHFASEEDATHLYIPKALQGQTSFQQSGFLIPPNVDGAVLNHMRVVMCASAIPTERRRSFDQLKRMADDGDSRAASALEALSGLEIEGA
jgi:hypothetical protein